MTPEEHYEKAFQDDWSDESRYHALMVIATDVIERRAAEASAVKMEVATSEATPVELTLDEALSNLVTALNAVENLMPGEGIGLSAEKLLTPISKRMSIGQTSTGVGSLRN